MTSNTPPAIAESSSSMESDAESILTCESVAPDTRKRKLSPERSSPSLLEIRQFYHSNGQPMSLEEVMNGEDSADEMDDDNQMLRHFEGANKVEAKFMNMWNSFVKKQRVLADSDIPWACEAFSKFHKKELLNCSHLNGCWRMFMIKMWGYGLVDAITINNCNLMLENCNNSDNTNSNNSVDHPTDIKINDKDVEDDGNNNKDE